MQKKIDFKAYIVTWRLFNSLNIPVSIVVYCAFSKRTKNLSGNNKKSKAAEHNIRKKCWTTFVALKILETQKHKVIFFFYFDYLHNLQYILGGTPQGILCLN